MSHTRSGPSGSRRLSRRATGTGTGSADANTTSASAQRYAAATITGQQRLGNLRQFQCGSDWSGHQPADGWSRFVGSIPMKWPSTNTERNFKPSNVRFRG